MLEKTTIDYDNGHVKGILTLYLCILKLYLVFILPIVMFSFYFCFYSIDIVSSTRENRGRVLRTLQLLGLVYCIASNANVEQRQNSHLL